jgi:hypothetical protein
MRPERAVFRVSSVSRLILAVRRRLWWRQFGVCALLGASVFLLLTASGTLFLAGIARAAIAIAAGGMAVAALRGSATPAGAAAAIERFEPSCRNVVITAEELHRHPERASARVIERVTRAASEASREVRAQSVVPAHHIAVPFGATVVMAALASPYVSTPAKSAIAAITRAVVPAPAAAPLITVVVESPAYTHRPAITLTNPDRIEALEGSRIRFELPPDWRVRFGNHEVTPPVLARASGYFVVEPQSHTSASMLIPLTVQPDRSPSVRITAPAKDLLLADGSATIRLSASASDDLGLDTLEIRYTRVSGSGEHFEFVEGTLPAAVRRRSTSEWQADATLALPALRLGPGDSVVYRAVARDERPGRAGTATSETYFIEIAGPWQIALAGVDMPPELDRYAMSQQMIVVKLERLRKRESTMTRETLREEAASLAAEQRTVRGNFIFLLGGHVEDEEEEAAQSHEIQEGRLENTARRDINAAISQMTRVEQSITALDIGAALPPARAAVEALQRAFGHSRYLLRSLAVRARLDPSRRLTGDLADATGWRRTVGEPPPPPQAAIRSLLAVLLESVQLSRAGQHPDARRLLEIGELALKIDPAAAVWQGISREITAARDTATLERVSALVSGQLVAGTLPRTGITASESPLERAFRTERR